MAENAGGCMQTRIGLVASVVSDTSDKMDTTALLPTSVLRNLSDKLYEKRKNAALEVSFNVSRLQWFHHNLTFFDFFGMKGVHFRLVSVFYMF